jgi:predicted RNA-binding Zn-ribbon protein involved in translation (DUF1610 family)
MHIRAAFFKFCSTTETLIRRALFSISISRRQVMDCPICGLIAERIATAIDGVSIACPMCGQFDIASSVIASGQLQGLALEERADVLGRARRSAEPGARPMITPYLLA